MRVFEQWFHFSKVNGPAYKGVTHIYSTIHVKQERVCSETGTQITWVRVLQGAVGHWNTGLKGTPVFFSLNTSIVQEIESQIFILTHTVTVVTRQD